MASEYLKRKYQDVRPDPKVELTPAQRRRNWWHYHKWHVLIGVLLALAAADILRSVLGIGQIRPDCCVAYVAQRALSEETAAALEAALSGLGTDANRDGRVSVQLRQYVSGPADGDPYQATVAYTTLLGDLEDRESYLFLLDDPAYFQNTYQVLCHLDGSLPPDDDLSGADTCLAWSGCPVLAGLELGEGGQAALSGLYVARRGFWTEDTVPYPEAGAALWDALTAGAGPEAVWVPEG